MDGMSPLAVLGILWCVVTVIMLALVIYRAVIGIHEENQLFLDRAEAALEQEQVATLKRIKAIEGFIKLLGIASGALFLVVAAIWVYQGLYGPPS